MGTFFWKCFFFNQKQNSGDLRYPFKARIPTAANKELISERPSFELRGASEKLHRPISYAKFDSGSIGDFFLHLTTLTSRNLALKMDRKFIEKPNYSYWTILLAYGSANYSNSQNYILEMTATTFVDFSGTPWPSNAASGSEISQIGIFVALWNYNEFIWILTSKMLFWHFWTICGFLFIILIL